MVAEDSRADISNALQDRRTGRVLAYGVDYLKQEYVPLTDELKADQASSTSARATRPTTNG